MKLRQWRAVGLCVCTLGGSCLGACVGAKFANPDAQLIGIFGGLSAGYGLFASLTGSY